MTAALIQFALAAFGLAALAMALSKSPKARKWAPVVGLCGQPFWLWFAGMSGAWGLFVTSVAYSAVYLLNMRGFWRVAP